MNPWESWEPWRKREIPAVAWWWVERVPLIMGMAGAALTVFFAFLLVPMFRRTGNAGFLFLPGGFAVFAVVGLAAASLQRRRPSPVLRLLNVPIQPGNRFEAEIACPGLNIPETP